MAFTANLDIFFWGVVNEVKGLRKQSITAILPYQTNPLLLSKRYPYTHR